MDRPGVRQVPEGSGEQGKMEETGCKIICGAPTTLAVKGLMMMLFLESIRTDALEDHEGTVSTGGRAITNLRYADDIDGFAEVKEELAK